MGADDSPMMHHYHHHHQRHVKSRCVAALLLCLAAAVVAGSTRGPDESQGGIARGEDHQKWYETAMRVRGLLESLPDKEARRGNGAPALCAAALVLSEVAVQRILNVDSGDAQKLCH